MQELFVAVRPLEAAVWDVGTLINFWSAVGQVGAAALSGLALIVSTFTFSRQVKLQRWQLRVARESHIIAWAGDCIDVLAETEAIVGASLGRVLDDLDRHRLVALGTRLSAQIDHGRLYFPNVEHPEKGRDKDTAFRGSRQPILDNLVDHYDATRALLTASEMPVPADACKTLTATRRGFISEAQSAIDPRRFGRIMARR